MRFPLLAAACALLVASACTTSLMHTTDIVDLDTSGPGNSGNITVTGSWNLVYSWDCSRQASERVSGVDRFDMIVYNSDDMSTAFEHPEVHRTGRKGGATLHFTTPGEYNAAVDTVCDWHLQAVDLSQ